MALAEQHEKSARLLATDRIAAGQAYFHVGIAAECALKGLHYVEGEAEQLAGRRIATGSLYL
jgi:hypothetical protein